MAWRQPRASDPTSGVAMPVGEPEWFSVETRARLEGARGALAAAEAALDAFEREHADGLLIEVLPRAIEARDRWVAAGVEMAEADAVLTSTANEIHGIGERGARPWTQEIPESPLSREARQSLSVAALTARRQPDALLPVPASILRGEDAA